MNNVENSRELFTKDLYKWDDCAKPTVFERQYDVHKWEKKKEKKSSWR